MAKLPSKRKLLREDLKEAPAWIDNLLGFINPFFEDVYFAFNKNITFKENIASQIRELNFETTATYDPFIPDTTVLQAEIDALDVRVDDIESEIVIIKDDITDIEAELAGFSSTITNVSSTYSVLTTDNIILCSGNFFVLTLPTAVGVTGKQYTIKHVGTSLSQFYAINTTSGQTVGGIASGSYALYTNQETLKIVSNGSNWIILDHFTETGWTDVGAISLSATGSNPTKPSGLVEDKMLWKREGDSARILMRYKQNGRSGVGSGSGAYIFALPNGISADTTITNVYAPTGTSANTSGLNQNIGSAMVGYVSNMRPAIVYIRSSTQFGMFAYNVGASSLISVDSDDFNLNAGDDLIYAVDFKVPASGWKP